MTIDEAWRILGENQLKRTKNREVLLDLFLENDRYLTAGKIKDFMEAKNPGISFDTIYRNLSSFTELGILEETELIRGKTFSNALRGWCPSSSFYL